jgi:hypothetical protein
MEKEKKVSELKAIFQLNRDLRELKKYKGKEDPETFKAVSKIIKSAYSNLAGLFKKDEYVQMLVEKIHESIDNKDKEEHDRYTKALRIYLITKRVR